MKIRTYRLLPLLGTVCIFLMLSACSSGNSPELAAEQDNEEQGNEELPNEEQPNEEQPNEEQPNEEQPSGEQQPSAPENEGDNPDTNDAPFSARYRITFDATWRIDTHPVNFPTNPHFSPLVGTIHSEQSVFWQRGQIASAGIEQMAETGATSTLLAEIQTVIDEGRALSAVRGGGIGTSPGSVELEVAVNRDFPLVTLVSMLAPSPDWFMGVNSLSMLDDNGNFVSTVSIDLRLYDSGTDNGTRFDSGNDDTQPPSPIDLVTSTPTDSDFVNGEPFVGNLLFEKIE